MYNRNLINESMLKRIQGFRESIREGLTYVCANCRRIRFKNQVLKWDDSLKNIEKVEIKSNHKLFTKCTEKPNDETLKTNDEYWICHTCKQYFSKGKVAPMSHYNNLQIYTEEDVCQLTDEEKHILSSLSQLEQTLIALNVPFQLLYQTPVSRWKTTQGRLTNVPLTTDKVMSTIKSIPTSRNQNSIVSVELKKKKE